MDESLIYIIILVVIYLVRFFMKSKEEGPATQIPDDEPLDRPTGPKKPGSLEELLEELTRNETKPEVEVEEYRPEYETLEDPYYQYQPEKDAEARAVYEKSVSQAKKFKTIDDEIDLEKIKVKIDEPIGRGKIVASSKYSKMLRNRQSLKDAIIMSEILKRKYD